MPKPEIEFSPLPDLPWQPVPGYPQGLTEKILSSDPETRSVTRLLKFEPGARITQTLTHDFWEEVYILEGGLTDLGKSQSFSKGMYACRPPGMVHGPYHSPEGCLTIEFRYYSR